MRESSRCQRFDFKRIPPKRIAERLAKIADSEKIVIGTAGLAALARAAEGSMRDAQSLFDQVISFAGREDGKTVITDAQITESLGLIDRQLFTDLLQALANRDGKAALDVAQRVATAGYEVTHFAREMLARIRDLMVVKVVADDPARLVDLSPEELEGLRALATKFTREEVDAIFLMLEQALEEMVRGDAPQLALEMAVLRMAAVEPIAPIAELVLRVESLAGGGSAKPAPARSVKGWQPPEDEPRASAKAAPADSPRPAQRTAAERPAESGSSPVRVERAAEGSESRRSDERPERTVTATIEAPIFDWDGFISFVKNRKPLLGRLISDGTLSRFDGEELRIGYDTTGVSAERVREQDSLEQIATLARDFLKRQIAVKIVALGSTPQPANAPPKRNTAEDRNKLREEALANDAIKSAMDVLGAELAEVKPPNTRST